MRRLAGAENHDAPPIYILFDGSAMSACLLGRWRDPHTSGPPNPVRGPGGLKFLDLIQRESIVDAIEDGEEQVRAQTATRYRLKLDMDRVQWPDPDPVSQRSQGNSLVGRLLNKALPDPRPAGVLSAYVWIDVAGRLVRYSHSDVPADQPKHEQAPWITTELWDFGIPPPLSNWKTQPVIDPVTLQFPETEAELMRKAKSTPGAPN